MYILLSRSYAWAPARRAASKKGDLRYHGPKYRVVWPPGIVTPKPSPEGKPRIYLTSVPRPPPCGVGGKRKTPAVFPHPVRRDRGLRIAEYFRPFADWPSRSTKRGFCCRPPARAGL